MFEYDTLKYFDFGHLPEALKTISSPFHSLAYVMANAEPSGHPETSAGLRKLLEAKDCAVRAAIKH